MKTAAAPASETSTTVTKSEPLASPTVPATAGPVTDQTKASPSPTDKAVATSAKQAAAEADSEEDSVAAEDAAPAQPKAVEKKKDKNGVINIKPGKSRITLKATQASWVQVTDAQQNVLYRKVLRPGEQYSVPDQTGLSLDTANAGGLNIIVDGKQVQSVGKAGEIVRGVVLDPKELKIQRMQVRN